MGVRGGGGAKPPDFFDVFFGCFPEILGITMTNKSIQTNEITQSFIHNPECVPDLEETPAAIVSL